MRDGAENENCFIQVITNATEKIMSRLAYQIPLYTLYLLPIVMIIGLYLLPESPVSYILYYLATQNLRQS